MKKNWGSQDLFKISGERGRGRNRDDVYNVFELFHLVFLLGKRSCPLSSVENEEVE